MKTVFLFLVFFSLERASFCFAEDTTEPVASDTAEVSETTDPVSDSEPTTNEPVPSEPAPEPVVEPEPQTATPEPAPNAPNPEPAPVSTPSSETSSSSPLAFGIQGGQTLSNSSTSGNRQKTEIFGGAQLDLRIMDHFGIQAELNYIEKGWHPLGGLLQDEVSLKYLELPLFLKAKWVWNNLVPHAFAGPSIAYLHTAKRIENGITFDTTSSTTRIEYGIYVGSGLDILLSQNLELGGSVRYGWGLSDLSESALEPDVFNRVFQWVATLRFRI